MTRQSNPIRKILLSAPALAGAGVGAMALYARKNDFVGPAFVARYLTTPNSLVGPLFPTRPIRRANVPIEWPARLQPIHRVVSWKGEHRGLTWVLRETKTNSFLVAKDGVIVNEWCRNGVTIASPMSSWSVAKSVVGLVAGQLVGEGKLSEDTRLVEVLPEYATGGPFDSITAGHLLDMRSGIDLPEIYREWAMYMGVSGMMTTTRLPEYLMSRARNTFAVPGTVSDYRSIDTQYLSMMISRIENEPLATVVHKRIWDPIGALDHASWTLDRPDGIEKGFMGLNASPRDFLKVGQLVLDRGRVGDRQVVPESWIDRMSTPAGFIDSETHRWGYSAQWWHPTGSDEHEDMTALGVYGQYVYVNRKHGVVIAKSSDHGTEQDETELIDVFRQIAGSL